MWRRACPVLTSSQHANVSTSTFGDILFVQQCVMTLILKFVIQHNGAISASKLNMGILYAHASPTKPNCHHNITEVQQNLHQLASGEAKLSIS